MSDIGSFFQQKGLSINVSQSVFASGAPVFSRVLVDQVSSYSHTSSSFGGYWDAKFDIADSIDEIEFWFVNGLAANVTVKDNNLGTIWRGFANEITISFGQYEISVGPLLGMANDININYTTKRYNTNPPIGGMAFAFGSIVELNSQERYGILVDQFQVSNVSGAAEVDKLTDALLAKHAFPDVGRKLNTSSNEPKVTIACAGYMQLMDKFFVDLTDSTVTLSQKVKNIFGAEPNGIEFLSSVKDIQENTISVKNGEDGKRTGMNALKSLESVGDPDGRRQAIGVYDAPELTIDDGVVMLVTSSGDAGQEIRTVGTGATVNPWEVRPAQRIRVSDFLAGRNLTLFGDNDPRVMYIDQVNYTAPYTISLQGGNIHTIDQKLARLGLGGS